MPNELESLLAWISCIADAQPVETYTEYLRSAGFSIGAVEPHDRALSEMVHQVQSKLFAAEVMAGLKKIELPVFDFATATQMAKAALSAIQCGQLGYAIIVALWLSLSLDKCGSAHGSSLVERSFLDFPWAWFPLRFAHSCARNQAPIEDVDHEFGMALTALYASVLALWAYVTLGLHAAKDHMRDQVESETDKLEQNRLSRNKLGTGLQGLQ